MSKDIDWQMVLSSLSGVVVHENGRVFCASHPAIRFVFASSETASRLGQYIKFDAKQISRLVLIINLVVFKKNYNFNFINFISTDFMCIFQ